MSTLTDIDLYVRGSETLLASWEVYAAGSPQATTMAAIDAPA